MSEHHNLIEQFTSLISVKYPIIGLTISYGIMGFAAIFHNIPGIFDLEIPKIIMQTIQLLLGLGGFLIGYFTFKRNFKNKNKNK